MERIFTHVKIKYLDQSGVWVNYDGLADQATGMEAADGYDVERTITFSSPFIAKKVEVVVPMEKATKADIDVGDPIWIHFRYDFNVEYADCIPTGYSIIPEGHLTIANDNSITIDTTVERPLQ